MPCKGYVGGGLMIFQCDRQRSEPCAYCGRKGGIQCQFPLSGEKQGHTCDKSLCPRCAFIVNTGDLPDGFEQKEDGDTLYVCPGHYRFVERKKEGQ